MEEQEESFVGLIFVGHSSHGGMKALGYAIYPTGDSEETFKLLINTIIRVHLRPWKKKLT